MIGFNSKKEEFDIVVVGAGIAGCAVAMMLSPYFKVALLDKRGEAGHRVGENLPGVARRILKRLKILNAFEQQGHISSQGMISRWGTDCDSLTHNLSNPDGFGWFVSRSTFEALLRHESQQRGVSCIWPVSLCGVKRESGGWWLGTNTAASIYANFVIDAGGRQSPFVRQLNVPRRKLDRLIANWFTIEDHSKDCTGVIEACETGWWYSAPIPNNKRIVAFHTDSDLKSAKFSLQKLIESSRDTHNICALFSNLSADQIAFGGAVTANSSRLTQVAGSKWAALGDAALSFDPLSSQGMYHALASSAQLADLIIEGKNVDMQYSRQMSSIWAQYKRHRDWYYSSEMRWADGKFWQRRHHQLKVSSLTSLNRR